MRCWCKYRLLLTTGLLPSHMLERLREWDRQKEGEMRMERGWRKWREKRKREGRDEEGERTEKRGFRRVEGSNDWQANREANIDTPAQWKRLMTYTCFINGEKNSGVDSALLRVWNAHSMTALITVISTHSFICWNFYLHCNGPKPKRESYIVT